MQCIYFAFFLPQSQRSSCVSILLLVFLVLLPISMDVDFDDLKLHVVQSDHKIIKDFVLKKRMPAFQPRYLIHRVKRRRQRNSRISLVTSGSINQRLRLNYKRFTLHKYALTTEYSMIYAA